MSKLQSRNDVRLKRHARVRSKISGTPEFMRKLLMMLTVLL